MIDLDALEQRLHEGPVALTAEELLELVDRARGLTPGAKATAVALRSEAKMLARLVVDCNNHHAACRTEQISWVTLQLAWRILESR